MNRKTNIPSTIFGLFVLAALVFTVFGQTKQSEQDEKESFVKSQDDVVSYKLSPTPTMKEMTETSAKVREFIWEHWKSQTRGTVKFEAYSKEGERTVAEYRVKCVENEGCKLTAKIDSELRGRGKFSTEKFNKYNQFVAESVERVKIPKDYSSKRKSISKEANQSAKFYWIQLKDAAGKVLSEL